MKNIKRDNRGFSLVELIVAVAVIGIASIPILHALLTSTSISTNASQMADAGTVAENVMQVAQIFSKDAVLKNENANMKLALGETQQTTFNKTDNSITLNNINAGGRTYDAQVIYSAGEKDTVTNGFYEINNQKIAEYTSMDGVFTQGYKAQKDAHGNVDTDKQALASYNSAISGATLNSQSREIEINISKDTVNGKQKVFADVTYNYVFKYTLDGETEKLYRYKKEYSVFDKGFEVGERTPSAYIMYFPYYDSTKETISIYNLENVDINLFLIKLCPVYYDSATDTDRPVTDDELQKTELNIKELNHVTEIKQYYPRDYVNTDENVTVLYTNVGINLTTDQAFGGDFYGGRVIYQIFSGGLWYASATGRIDNNLILTTKKTRLWLVTVNVYAAGKRDKVLYTLTSSKVA